jgi:hypothetical protein
LADEALTMDKLVPKVDDVCEYIFGGPGPDITYVVVLSIDGEYARCWDLIFNFEIKIELKYLWPVTHKAEKMESGTWIYDRGRVTVRQLVDEYRASVSAGANNGSV